ncbi:hypothetical protein Xmar_20520 [Xanthomonas axonopodis pv. martyniicola]|nr:hypothetical protein Xmar_20520 [Xanthomonas axonopodis pv. martyniicola]OOW92340.1 hypothetical protein Xvtr_15805 [Xanthomonas campestris pv. vitiscarnosae]
MPLKLIRTAARQGIGDVPDMLEGAEHTPLGMRDYRPAVVHGSVALQALQLRCVNLTIRGLVVKEVLDTRTNVIGTKAERRIGMQIAINEAHAYRVAKSLYTSADASQSI